MSVTHVISTYCLSISKNSDIVSFHTALNKGFHTFIVDTCLQTQGLMDVNTGAVYTVAFIFTIDSSVFRYMQVYNNSFDK